MKNKSNLKHLAQVTAILFCFIISHFKTMAWGPEGHAIVGRIAMRYVTEDLRHNVLVILGKMPIDTAANWMDIMKGNADYDFMRSWHYLDFAKDKKYVSTNQENILNRLILTYGELQHKKILCKEQVRMDLLVLLHLMGDLHMPLHTGYDDDLGGNKLMVQYDTLKTHNLHRFWDEDIIGITQITDADCVKYAEEMQTQTNNNVDFEAWMQDTRALLPMVYNYTGFLLSENYLQRNKIVVEKQLMLAGLRLATILNKLFYSAAPEVDFKKISKRFKNSIAAAEAKTKLGKNVTICERVYNVRYSPTITQISLGGKYPEAPVTVIIFAKSYPNFKGSPEELFKDKNICVKGKITGYRGKMQIIVEDEDDILLIDE